MYALKIKRSVRFIFYVCMEFWYCLFRSNYFVLNKVYSKPVILFFMGGFGKGGAETVVQLMIERLYLDFKCIIISDIQSECAISDKFEVICLYNYSKSRVGQYHIVRKINEEIRNIHRVININSVSFLRFCIYNKNYLDKVKGKLITNFYMPNVFPLISKNQMNILIQSSNYVTSDHSIILKNLEDYYDIQIEKSKFIPLYNPIKFLYHYDDFVKVLSNAIINVNIKPIKFLWAARVDRQKNLSLFLDIANSNSEIIFEMYGEPNLGDALNEFNDLKTASNVLYKGKFSDLRELICHDHDYVGFLMTSKVEGLPNTLLEIGTIGIPIIAPNVGGISEIINRDTGYLVENNLLSYNKAIKELLNNNELTFKRSTQLRQLIGTRHTSEEFNLQLNRIFR